VIRLNGIGGVIFQNPDRNFDPGFFPPLCHPERSEVEGSREISREVYLRDSSTSLGMTTLFASPTNLKIHAHHR
jgi:hypothetical protein